MKIKQHYEERYRTGISLNKDRQIVPMIFFALSCIYLLTMLISGFNFLVEIAPIFAIGYAVVMLLTTIIKGKVGFFNFLSYVVLMVGTFFVYLIWGADPFGYRFGYNLMLVSLGLVGIVLIILSVRVVKDKGAQYIIVNIATILMIASALFYTLFSSIRLRPIATSLKKGHDDYLDAIRNGAVNCNDDDSPNVLIVLMDDMAYADISAFSLSATGEEAIHTPNIDAIASNGVMMDNAYASSPVCSPSRFGILTGRYPARGYLDNVVFQTRQQNTPFSTTRFFNPFQLGKNADGILGDEVTIAEVMKAKGYRTGLFGKWNLGDYGEYLPTQQGFDYFFGSHYINDMNPYNIVREERDADGHSVVREVKGNDYRLEQSESTKTFSAELDEYMSDCVDRGEKFFVEYWSPWPHFPIFSGEPHNKADDNYIDCIQEFDAYLGRTFDMLDQKGVLDDTLIIFTSDNGPGREGNAGNHRGRKNTPFEGGHKVPFLACWQNGSIGKGTYDVSAKGYKNIGIPSINLDIFPTLLDYCNVRDGAGDIILPTDRTIDGHSIRALLDGTSNERVHDAIYYMKRGKVEGIQMPMEATVKFKKGAEAEREITGTFDFKYFDNVHTENSAFIDQYYKNYLFNLTLDKPEAYNIAMTQPDIASKMKEELTAFRAELKRNRRGIIGK